MQRKKNYLFGLLSVVLIAAISCTKLRGHYGTRSYEPVTRNLNTADIKLPSGYTIQAISEGLTYPTAITFDDAGKIYVLEAGYSYGESFTEPRLLRLEPNGNYSV